MADLTYPGIEVPLTGEDGNAFFIIGRVGLAMRRAGIPKNEREAWAKEAMETPSYDALLQFVMQSVATI